MKNVPLKRRGFSYVTHFVIFGPLYIFGMVKGRNFVFGAHIDITYTPCHITNYPLKWAWSGSCDQNLKVKGKGKGAYT